MPKQHANIICFKIYKKHLTVSYAFPPHLLPSTPTSLHLNPLFTIHLPSSDLRCYTMALPEDRPFLMPPPTAPF